MSGNELCRLTVLSKDGWVNRIEVDGSSLVIGRDPQCDLCLDHRSVSRRHARLFRAGTDWYLSDLRSTNGTLVNGNRISNKWLQCGDSIRVGAYSLRFSRELADQPEEKPVPAPKAESEPESEAPRARETPVDLGKYYEEFPDASLETQHPRIWNEIFAQWGTPTCERYLHSLIYTERVDRDGFSLQVMSELLCLLHIHTKGAETALQ
ncbi:MAG: FHA domain-containing protein [Chromatiaceae bacterium]